MSFQERSDWPKRIHPDKRTRHRDPIILKEVTRD